MIQSVINRELLSFNNKINILFSRLENRYIINYIKGLFPDCSIVDPETTYYGHMQPDIIICNNRLTDLEKSIKLAKFFHIPLLIIDSDIKSELISNKIDNNFDFTPVVQIALSKDIYHSWNKIQNYIMDITDKYADQWKNMIYSLCKERFQIQQIKIDAK